MRRELDAQLTAFFPLVRTDPRVLELLNLDLPFINHAVATRWRNATETQRELTVSRVLDRAEELFHMEVHASLQCNGQRFRDLIYRLPVVGDHRAWHRRNDGRIAVPPLPIRYIERTRHARKNLGMEARREQMGHFAQLIERMVAHDSLGNIEMALAEFAKVPFEPTWLRALLADAKSRKDIATAFFASGITGAQICYAIIFDLSGRPGAAISVLVWETLDHYRGHTQLVVRSEVERSRRKGAA